MHGGFLSFRWYHVPIAFLVFFGTPFCLGIAATLAWQKWVPAFTLKIERQP